MLSPLKFENASKRRLCLKSMKIEIFNDIENANLNLLPGRTLTNLRHWSRLAKNIYSCIQLYAYYTFIDCV